MKIFSTAKEAIEKLESNQTIMVGGFGLIGAPLSLIDELTQKDVSGLTIISNNLGEKGKGLGILVNQKKVKKELALILRVIEMWEMPIKEVS